MTTIKKPRVVADYNSIMGGVDRSDEIATSHKSPRKSVKWYKKTVFLHIGMCLVNALCLQKELKPGSNITYLDFGLQWIQEVMDRNLREIPESRLRGRARTRPSPARLVGRHFPVFNPPTPKKRKPCRRCLVCQERGSRTETSYQCDECGVASCVAPCFRIYHTQVDYAPPTPDLSVYTRQPCLVNINWLTSRDVSRDQGVKHVGICFYCSVGRNLVQFGTFNTG